MKSFAVAVLTFASLSASASGPRLASVCEMLAQAELPGNCTATCETSGSGDTYSTLKISKGSQSVSSPAIGQSDRSELTENGDQATISAADDVAGYQLSLTVDSNDKVLSLTANEIQCK